jgi:hypothetical protein
MSKIRPVLRRLHSPDISDLESYRPESEERFGFLVQAMFGPEDSEGEESFDIVVCTPSWIEKRLLANSVVSGHHHLFLRHYSIEAVRTFLVKYALKCSGETWQDVAKLLSRIGKWEFEDYIP